jgi:hypothetical protein
VSRRRPAWRTILLACLAGVVVAAGGAWAATPPEPSADTGVRARLARWMLPHCLTPEAGRAVNALRESGSVAAVLPEGWSLTGGEIRSDAIVVEIGERDGARHAVTLALPGSTPARHADARGRTFAFAVAGAPPPAARKALLDLAASFDAAIPDAALQPCSGHDTSPADDLGTRRRSLLSAMLQAAILVAAIAFGLAALPRDVL